MTTERKALSPDVVGLELPASTFDYEERDVMLYALGIGAKELPFIFERNLKVIPTFAVIPAFPALMGLAQNVEINPVMLLHGEQGFRIAKTIPTSGSLTTSGTVTGVYDKGKGALITIDSTTTDASGETVFTNTSGVFIRGAGGFGGDRGPGAANNHRGDPGERCVGRRPSTEQRDDSGPPAGPPRPVGHQSGRAAAGSARCDTQRPDHRRPGRQRRGGSRPGHGTPGGRWRHRPGQGDV